MKKQKRGKKGGLWITASMKQNTKSLAHGHSREENSIPVSGLDRIQVQLADKRNVCPTGSRLKLPSPVLSSEIRPQSKLTHMKY